MPQIAAGSRRRARVPGEVARRSCEQPRQLQKRTERRTGVCAFTAGRSRRGSSPGHHGHAATSHVCQGSRVLGVCVGPDTEHTFDSPPEVSTNLGRFRVKNCVRESFRESAESGPDRAAPRARPRSRAAAIVGKPASINARARCNPSCSQYHSRAGNGVAVPIRLLGSLGCCTGASSGRAHRRRRPPARSAAPHESHRHDLPLVNMHAFKTCGYRLADGSRRLVSESRGFVSLVRAL